MTLTPEQRAEGWRENTGHFPAKDERTVGDVMFRGQTWCDMRLSIFGGWNKTDYILAYRITEPYGADAAASRENGEDA